MVGRKDADPKPDIILGDIAIKNHHAVFEKDTDENIFLSPAFDSGK